jgi:hypothetical protein
MKAIVLCLATLLLGVLAGTMLVQPEPIVVVVRDTCLTSIVP